MVVREKIGEWPHSVSVILATILYTIVAWVYIRLPKNSGRKLARWSGPISYTRLAVIGLVLLAISTAAIAVFVQQKGDFITAITEAALFKTSEDPLSNLAFAIKLSPFATIASFIFWHLYGRVAVP